jgi:hypothetical protein
MAIQYPQSGNEYDFQDFCARLYRKVWNNESLQLYAKRGEKQFGVDIHDPVGTVPVRAVQCKHHEPTKPLKPTEIAAEVAKAEKWHQRLERYVIATTARKSRDAQDEVTRLNARPAEERKFIVEVHFWEELCDFLDGFDPVQAYAIVHGHDAAKDLLVSLLDDARLASMARAALNISVAEEKDEDYKDIEALLTARDLDAARYAIGKLPAREEFDGLGEVARYKITRLRAKLALEEEDFDGASRLFFEAYELQPDLAQAKQNRVLAYGLANDRAQGFFVARRYLSEGLDSPVMLSRLVEYAPSREELLEVLPLVQKHLESDEDVNVALTHRLIGLGDPSGARAAGERAVKIAPESAHAHFAAGASGHNEANYSEGTKRKAALTFALEHYSDAAQLAGDRKYEGLLSEILMNRGAVYAMLQNEEAAKADYKAAVLNSSVPGRYAENAVSYFVNARDAEGASELLPYLDRSTEEGEFFGALMRFELAESDDERRSCFHALAALAEKKWSRSVESRLHCVGMAIRMRDWDLARSVIPEELEKSHPFQAYTALAWIAGESKEGDAAKFAGKAVAAGLENTHPADRRVLADILVALGDHATALTLLEQNVIPGSFDHDTRKLIECAQRVGRHDLLLRLCRELRETGEQPVELRQLEMELLNRYAPDQGLALVDRFIEAGERRGYFIAFKNALAVRLGRRELVTFKPDDLPTAKDLTPSQAPIVIYPYVEFKKVNEGIIFLYAQLRLNPDDPGAHENYINFITQYGNNGSLHGAIERIEGECAVHLEMSDGKFRWVVIENDAPSPSRNECSSDGDLAKCLEGKAVGDVVTLPGGIGLPEEATVRDIQTKYVRAFNDSIESFRARFPDEHFVQSMHMGSGDSLDLTKLIEVSSKQKQSAEEAIRFYLGNQCTLYLLAQRLGISERELIVALSQYPNGRVNCSYWSPGQWDAGSGITNEKIVLTVSGLTTLELVDGWEMLDRDKEYFVSQSTWELINSWVTKAEDDVERETAYTSVTDGGQLQVHAPTQEEKESKRDGVRALKERVKTLCTVASAESAAGVEPKRRDSYEEAVGFHNLEAICLAKERGALLWSDDALLSVFARVDFGVPSAWTQLALKANVDAKKLASHDHNLVTAKMVGLKYESIVWSVPVIMEAALLAEWDTSRWPFKDCIDLVGRGKMPWSQRAGLVLDLLEAIRTSGVDVWRQSAIIQAVLTAVKNPRLVRAIYGRLADLLGGNIVALEFLKPEFEYWLRNHLT